MEALCRRTEPRPDPSPEQSLEHPPDERRAAVDDAILSSLNDLLIRETERIREDAIGHRFSDGEREGAVDEIAPKQRAIHAEALGVVERVIETSPTLSATDELRLIIRIIEEGRELELGAFLEEADGPWQLVDIRIEKRLIPSILGDALHVRAKKIAIFFVAGGALMVVVGRPNDATADRSCASDVGALFHEGDFCAQCLGPKRGAHSRGPRSSNDEVEFFDFHSQLRKNRCPTSYRAESKIPRGKFVTQSDFATCMRPPACYK